MRAWTKPTRWLVSLAVTVTCTCFAIVVTWHQQWYFELPDVKYYLLIAQGDTAHAMEPFVARQFAPLLARGLAHLTGWTVETAFIREGMLYLAATIAMTYWLVVRTVAPRWMLAAIFFVPFWPQLFEGLAYPDLLFSMLLGVMMVLLARRNILAAALMLLPMMLTRESTWLVLVCFLVATWQETRWKARLTAVAASFAGALAVRQLTLIHGPNQEHLPQTIYMAAKVPWNFALNVLGIVPWSNITTDHCAVPRWQWAVHAGPLHSLGVCTLSANGPRVALYWALSVFGALPALTGFLWWHRRKSTAAIRGEFASSQALLRFVLLYGGLCFVLAPVLGMDLRRLFGYAWPLFLVAPALLLNEQQAMASMSGRAWAISFCVVHLALCAAGSRVPSIPSLWLEAGLMAVACLLLRQWFSARYLAPAETG